MSDVDYDHMEEVELLLGELYEAQGLIYELLEFACDDKGNGCALCEVEQRALAFLIERR